MKKKVFSVVATFALATFIATGSVDAASATHTVKPGDTLWKIASQHKLSIDELRSLNKLTSDSIKLNQKLTIQKAQASVGVNKVANVTSSVSSYTSQVSKSVISKVAAKGTNTPVNIPLKVPSVVTPPIVPTSSTPVIETALSLLDTPYLWAGVTIDGFDCSGFIYYALNTSGVKIPRWDTQSMYTNSVDIAEPIPGDLVFFENTYRIGISHAGIYLGEGNFIHAGSKKVEISSIDSGYWKDKFTGFKRFTQVQK